MNRHIGIFALLLGACTSTEPPALGPIEGHIIAGQHQTAVAGDQQLGSAVVEQIVRNPLTGKLEMRRIRPWEKLLLPAVAYAQTVVNGSPVPGAVVCVYEGDVGLTPFSRCTNTNNEGKATFFFEPSTTAGDHIARINGTVTVGDRVEATTFDTVYATVLPDVPDANYRIAVLPLQCSPAVFPADGVRDRFGNAVPYRIVADGRLAVAGTTAGTMEARTVTFTAEDADPSGESNFYLMELRGADEVLVGRLQYRIGTGTGSCPGGTQGHRIDWTAAGASATP